MYFSDEFSLITTDLSHPIFVQDYILKCNFSSLALIYKSNLFFFFKAVGHIWALRFIVQCFNRLSDTTQHLSMERNHYPDPDAS